LDGVEYSELCIEEAHKIGKKSTYKFREGGKSRKTLIRVLEKYITGSESATVKEE